MQSVPETNPWVEVAARHPEMRRRSQMDDELFRELVAVLSFSEEAAAIMGGSPLPAPIHRAMIEEARVRGFEDWTEAVDWDGTDLEVA